MAFANVQDFLENGVIFESVSFVVGDAEYMGQRQAVLDVLERLYLHDTFRLDVIDRGGLSSTNKLTVKLESGSMVTTFLGGREIRVDATFETKTIDYFGVAWETPLWRMIAHEIFHAVGLGADVLGDLDGSEINPDYLGVTVSEMNRIFGFTADGTTATGEILRASYSSQQESLGSLEALQNGVIEELDGREFDNVLVAFPNAVGQQPLENPGEDVLTRRNTEDLNDLILGGSGNYNNPSAIIGNGVNEFRSGLGDDWLFGGAGSDILYGDEGSDYLHGGSQIDEDGQLDAVQYWDGAWNSENGVYDFYESKVSIRADDDGKTTVLDGGGDTDTLVNIEFIRASQQDDDLEFVGEISNHQALDLSAPHNFYVGGFQNERGDFANFSQLGGEGINVYAFSDVDLDALYFSNAVEDLSGDTVPINGPIEWLRVEFDGVPADENIRLLYGFENYALTNGNDKFIGGEKSVTVYGNEGDDNISGSSVVDGDPSPKSGAADEIHGGLGNDTIDGGTGADVIYDNGNIRPIEEDEDQEEYDEVTEAYDADGNDMVYGGAGADVLFHSGGIDTFEGGAGDDRYEFSEDLKPTDQLTLRFSETASDPETFFGHDLLQNGGEGVDSIILAVDEGVEVSYSYSYEIVEETSTVWDYNGIFWFDDIGPYTVTQFLTVGTYEIFVEGSGSSITVDNVAGRYFEFEGGDPLLSPAFDPLIEMNFVIYNEVNGVIDSGVNDWTFLATDASGQGTGSSTDAFAQGMLTETGYDALVAHEVERAISDALQEGTEQDDDMFGTNGANNLSGGSGSDRLRGGAGGDTLTGGVGADSLDGGTGVDIASYADATTGVVASLASPSALNSGDAEGDTYTDIENLNGSAFDDDLRGSDGANTLFGGDGDDTFWGNSSTDTAIGDVFYGGDGNDIFNPYNNLLGGAHANVTGGWGDDSYYGGTGADLIRTGSGDDVVQAGAGDDTVLVIQSALPGSLSGSSTSGNNSIDGGDGVDLVQFETFGNATNFIVDLVAGRTDNSATGETNLLTNLENVIVDAANSGNTTVFGDDGANDITTDGGDDVIYGGAGDDIIDARRGNDSVYGGSGTGDRVSLGATYNSTLFVQVDGGLVGSYNSGTVFIARDNEYVDFYDGGQLVETRTYAEIATANQTEFEVLNDFFRVAEGSDGTISFEANDLPFNGEVLTIVEINGTAVGQGDSVRLDSGATILLDQSGVLVFDQAGAFADLGIGETAQVEFTYTSQNAQDQSKTASALIVVDGDVPSGGSLENEGNLIFLDTTLANPFNPGEPYIQVRQVSNFDIFNSLVLIDQTSVDPTDVATLDRDGISTFYVFENASGDTVVTDRATDSAIVLQDISLEAWQWAVSQKTPELQGDAGNNFLFGTASPDTVYGEEGNDTLFGRAGEDALLDGAGNDTVFGEGGDDKFYLAGGDNTYFGGLGDDRFDGASSFGGTHAPTEAFVGVNVFDGGAGIDALVFNPRNFAPIGVTVDLVDGTIDWNGTYENDTVINVEDVGGTGSDDIIRGDNNNNRLGGLGGDNVLEGRGGDDLLEDTMSGSDTLFGGEGDDTILLTLSALASSTVDSYYGGVGSDTLDLQSVDSSSNSISVDLATETIGSFSDVLVGFENLIGTRGNNTLSGNSVANTLNGAGGNDTLNGREGDDVLIGGTSSDVLTGGAGFDTFSFLDGDGSDVVTDFDIFEDAIVINGTIIDPNAVPSGIVVEQRLGDVHIEYQNDGGAGQINIENVLLTEWLAAIGPVITTEIRDYDDGRVLETTFLDGVRSSATMTDHQDAYIWSSYTDQYDESGQRTLRELQYDDGRELETSYVNGVRATNVFTDNEGRFAWSTINQMFDQNGVIEFQTNTYDDGRLAETSYDAGTKTALTLIDVNDTVAWSRIDDTFDDTGGRTVRETAYDDGREGVTTYNGNVRQTNMIMDSSDAFVWASIAQTFDASNALSAQTNTYDDGRILEVQYASGIKQSATMTDVEDAYAWASYLDEYDTNGVRISRTLTYDDDREVVIDFV